MLVSKTTYDYDTYVLSEQGGLLFMLHDNIRYFRKAKGMSQEELAQKLNVVRQTISKWEKGISIPDADILIRISECLDVSVSRLLGIKEDNIDRLKLSQELVKLNARLLKKEERERLVKKVNQKRGLILLFSFLTMFLMLILKNEIASILLVGLCVLVSVIVLYRNLTLFTSITTDDMKIGILRCITFFNFGILIIGILFSLLIAFDIIIFTENSEKMFAMSIVSCVMFFGGIISSKLPYSKHTGLRLPWTVQDKETWSIAHRIIEHISLPIVLLYIACTLSIDNFEFVTLVAMLVWIGIPAIISYIFFKQKIYGQ